MESNPLIAGLDVGTTNVKALIAEPNGHVLATASVPTPTNHPQPGWAHYEPEDIWSSACQALRQATSKVPEPDRIAGIAVASIGETAFPVNQAGQTTFPGIAWYDTRARTQCDWLVEHIGAERIYATCRMSIQPIYGLCKMLWLRDNEPRAFSDAVCWLNTADYVAFRLSGEKATDPSLASRALLFDVDRFAWARSLLEDCGLSPELLAPLHRSGTAIGTVLPDVAEATGIPSSAQVSTGGHDHVVGALGVGVTEPGTVLNSLGTAEALFLPILSPLNRPEMAQKGYSVGGHVAWDRFYAIGGLYSSGGSVNWVKSLLGDLNHRTLLESASNVEPGSLGVLFLPHLRIANPPFGDAPSRGAFVGLSGDVDKGILYRAVLEGIAMEAKLCLGGLLDYAELENPDRIIAIGGSTRNDLLMQIKASVYDRAITVSSVEEGTALGAALLGGLGAGVYSDLEDISTTVERRTRTIESDPGLVSRYAELFETYAQVYPSLKELNSQIDANR